MKKYLAILLALVMMFSLVACAQSNEENSADPETSNTPSTSDTPSTNDTSSTSDAPEADQQVEFEVWFPANDAETGKTTGNGFFIKQAEKYMEENSNVKINITYIGENADDFQAKWTLAAANDNLPDMIVAVAGNLDEWAANGVIINMKDDIAGFADAYSAGSLESTNQYCEEGSVYGIPLWTETQGWMYNTELFDQCGLEVPETYEDLLNCIEVFNANGITPIAHGGTDKWAIWGYHSFFTRYGLTYDMAQQLQTGELKFADCEPITKTFARLEELHNAGAFNADANSTSHAQALARFEEGQAAMYTIYSAVIPGLQNPDTVNRTEYNLGPEFADGALDGRSGLRMYGWTLALGNSAKSDDAKYAAIMDFLKFQAGEVSAQIAVNDGAAPPTSTLEIPAGSSQFAAAILEAATDDYISTTDPFNYWFDTAYLDTYRSAVTGVICGDINAAEAVQLLQEVTDMNT